MTAAAFKFCTPGGHVHFEYGSIRIHNGENGMSVYLTPQEAVDFASVLLQYGTDKPPAPAHRVTEPHVDRYFNGGDDLDETFPERLSRLAEVSRKARESAVLAEHTNPYRSNVTFFPLEEDDA